MTDPDTFGADSTGTTGGSTTSAANDSGSTAMGDSTATASSGGTSGGSGSDGSSSSEETAASESSSTGASSTGDSSTDSSSGSSSSSASSTESSSSDGGSSSSDGTSDSTSGGASESSSDGTSTGDSSSSGSSSSDGGSSTGGPDCGTETCVDGDVCLGEACSCIEAIAGDTVLRVDGTVIHYTGGFPVIQNGETMSALDGVDEVFEGQHHGCALRDDGTVWCWLYIGPGDTAGQLGDGSVGGATPVWEAHPVQIDPMAGGGDLTGAVQINGGSSMCYLTATSCAILDDGTLWCWGASGAEGSSGEGFFNDGNEGSHPYATQINASVGVPLTGVEAVSLGVRHACALRNGGEVWCWGTNVGGPLGQGDQMSRDFPVQVSLPGPASQIVAGSDVSCARVADNVYCWGSTGTGQVGLGDPASNTDGCINFCRLTPALVIDDTDAPLDGVTDLSGAYLANCALRGDQSLWCWGAQYSNVAAPLQIIGTLVDDVALHSACGSDTITTTARYVTTSDELFRGPFEVAQECG